MQQSTPTTSKIELIKWMNETFKLNISTLEQLGSGLAFCQIFDFIHSNSIPSSKLNWKANQEVDNIRNYKVLADAFHKASIQKQLDIQSLAKGKYQDILDMAQFMKSKFDKMHEKRENYDPEEYRAERKIIIPQIRRSLKDKTNENNVIKTTSQLIKRPASLQWRKKLVKKNPDLTQIHDILATEEDEVSKINRIRQLFI